MQLCVSSDLPAGDVWLYRAVTALLSDLPAELTACTEMLVYTLFLSSPVKLIVVGQITPSEDWCIMVGKYSRYTRHLLLQTLIENT